MSTQYHPTTKATAITAAQKKAIIAEHEAAQAALAIKVTAKVVKPRRITKAEKEAIVRADARKQKVTAVKAKANHAGKAVVHGGVVTAVVGGKVVKTLWNGAFGAMKGVMTLAQNVPNVAVGTVVVAGLLVAEEYNKA